MGGAMRTDHTSHDDYSTEVRMLFGKHKGKLLSAIPLDYLLWLQTEADIRPALEVAVKLEVARRYQGQARQSRSSQAVPRLPAGVSLGTALQVIDGGRRELARKNHPDVGG